MFTVVIYRKKEDVGNASVWVQDFENAGLGKTFCADSLTDDLASEVLREVRGKESWSLLLLCPCAYSKAWNVFLDKLMTAVRREREYALCMPGKVWIIWRSFRHQGKPIGKGKIRLERLPAYCRCLEYVIDLEERKVYQENLELWCIVILIAANNFSSENFVVYQMHRVRIEIDREELRRYLKGYKDLLEEAAGLAERRGSRLTLPVAGHEIEVDQELPSAIGGINDFFIDDRIWKQKSMRSMEEYFSLNYKMDQEREAVQREVQRQGRYWDIYCEKEFSQRDLEILRDKKQENEICMLKINLNLEERRRTVRENLEQAERNRKAEEMVKWGKAEIFFDSLWAMLGVLLVTGMTIIELLGRGFEWQVDYRVLLAVLGVAAFYGIGTSVVMSLYNIWYKVTTKSALKRAWGRFCEFIRKSRNEIQEYALLCCRIGRKQAMLRGHLLSKRRRMRKVEGMKQHYAFCMDKMEKINELERLFGEIGISGEGNEHIEIGEPDYDLGPEQTAIYNALDKCNWKGKIMNESGERVLNPFPFVAKFHISREFRI